MNPKALKRNQSITDMVHKAYEAGKRIVKQEFDSYSYDALHSIISDINEVQRQFQILKKCEEDPLYRTGIKFADKARKVINKPPMLKDYHTLFSANIRNVKRLTEVSTYVFTDAKEEYDTLASLVDDKLTQQQRLYETKARLDSRIPALTQDYEEHCRFMEGMKPGEYRGNSSYFELKRRKLELERKLDIVGYGVYGMTLDKQVNNNEITTFYENMERLFRFSYLTAERIKESSAEINDTLSNTQRIYKKFDNIYEATQACRRGLNFLDTYHRELNSHFSDGIQNMIGIINNNPGIRMFGETNEKLTRFLNDIEATHHSINYSNEMRVNEP